MSLRPSVSVVLTIYDRPLDVLRMVGISLRDSGADEVIAVLDRSPDTLVGQLMKGDAGIRDLGGVVTRWVSIRGESGWKCPSAAWNAGFRVATGDIIYCLSSDTVQRYGNVERARRILSEKDAVVFGACIESDYERAVADPSTTPELCSSSSPRPLGFIMAMPRWAVEKIGGYDEAFMAGQWHEDKDFSWRLWKLGLHFVFWDQIAGIHQTHDRGFLDHMLIGVNRRLFIRKWGCDDLPWPGESQTVRSPGMAIWLNPRHSSRAA